MKLPNGYGSIYKLSGKRRRSWAIRVDGKYIGYAATKREALRLLEKYHENPYNKEVPTFSDVYEIWLKHKSHTICEHTVKNYVGKYNNYCKPLYNRPFKDIKLKDYYELIDSLDGVQNGTINNLIKLLRALDQTAYEFDIIPKSYAKYIKYKPVEKKQDRIPFSEEEIAELWEHKNDKNVDLVLILLYTGMRSGEFSKIKISDIHFDTEDGDYMIGGSKTESGKNRFIPIHPKIRPFIEDRINKSKNDTLLSFSDKTLRQHFKNVMERYGMKHIPHECRHTFISRMDNLNINRNIIDLIVGHKSNHVGERIYTHKTYEQLQEAMMMLD